MDASISSQIMKLIELDQRAVALSKQRDNDIEAMEQSFQGELAYISKDLQLAKDEAKRIYEQMLQKAEAEVASLDIKAEKKLQAIESNMSEAIESLSNAIWKKLKEELE